VRYAQQRLAEIRSQVGTRSDPPRERKPRKYAPDATHKRCTVCAQSLPLDHFSPHPAGALGVNPACKACRCAVGREQTRKRLERVATRPRPEHCECCGAPSTARHTLHWDHNHATGLFRGWICHGCNSALGQVGDSVERLRKLIRYLERS